MEQETNIETTPTAPEVVFPENGLELPNEHGIEVVVHDDNGWHKELKEPSNG